jgi:SAM-dependent methyltransferase
MAPLPVTAPLPAEPHPDFSGGSAFGQAIPCGTVDPAAIAAITDLYRETMPAGGAILDLMSGWVGHLPPEVPYSRVVGLGINPVELAENAFLDEWRVQDLNQDPRLPFRGGEFDGAAICASVQYLTRPCDVIREVGRVLKAGAPLIVTFSSCCLATRPIACWRLLDDAGHLCLVARFFSEAGNWSDIRYLDLTPPGGTNPLYAVIGRSLGPGGNAD